MNNPKLTIKIVTQNHPLYGDMEGEFSTEIKDDETLRETVEALMAAHARFFHDGDDFDITDVIS